MAHELKEEEQLLNTLLSDYLKTVLATANLPQTRQEIEEGIKLLNKVDSKTKSHHLIFPYPGDSLSDSIDMVRKMMEQLFRKDPHLVATQKLIDLQESNFQRFKEEVRSSRMVYSPFKG